MENSLLHQYLWHLVKNQGSDLHLKAMAPPRIRVAGRLVSLRQGDVPDASQVEEMARQIMVPEKFLEFQQRHEGDFAYVAEGIGRFRVNIFRQKGEISMVFRHVKDKPPTFEELSLPGIVKTLSMEQRGLVLVTGPTGSGKTSTLAAMVDHINRTRPCHIVTIEDPVEVMHEDLAAIVNQREIGFDTDDFAVALRAAMRQDPDVILVGEMRDLDTVSAAIQAAETGHLVLSTLHTIGVAETITRIIDFFPTHQQQQIRVSLAGILRGVICQRLVRTTDPKQRVPALEVMVNNGRIQQCIIDADKTQDIHSIVAEGEYYGMLTFDQSLRRLYEERKIGAEEALENATNAHDLRLALSTSGLIPS